MLTRKTIKMLSIICLLAVLLNQGFAVRTYAADNNSATNQATIQAADEFDNMRIKYKQLLTGYNPDDPYDLNDPNVIEKIDNIDKDALECWQSMDQTDHTWDDTRDASATDTTYINRMYSRLRQMALAWATFGSDYYQNAELLGDVIAGLDWVYANRYNENIDYTDGVPYGNWFHWQVASPFELLKTVCMLYEQLDYTRVTNYMAAINHFTPDSITSMLPNTDTADPNDHLVEVGSNRVSFARVCILRAIIIKDSTKITQTKTELDETGSSVFEYSTYGVGFFEDGSYIYHKYFPYIGGYGLNHMNCLVELFWLLDGTTWSFSYADPQSQHKNVFDWISNGFLPNMFNGQMFESVKGRASAQPHGTGTAFLAIDSLLLLAELDQNSNSTLYKQIIKEHIGNNSIQNSYYHYASIYNLQKTQEIMNDTQITPYQEPDANYFFYNMARAVHKTQDWVFNISMHYADPPEGVLLPEIHSYEGMSMPTGGENIEGWYTSDGMTYLYLDSTDYAFNYFPTVDRHRLPGITVDRDISRPGSAHYGGGLPSDNNWVGGVSLSSYGTAGIDFKQHSYETMDVNAKKSWFMFDDEIVALGSDINSTSGRQIETVVENRSLNSNGDNALTIDGNVYTSTLGWSQHLDSALWAHIDNAGGYVFPTGMDLNFLREEREGSDEDIDPYAPFKGNDEFNSTIKAGNWVPVRESAEDYVLTGTDLQIQTKQGTLSGSTNTTENLFLTDAPNGDFYITTKLTFSPSVDGQEAGLILYLDDDNYVSFSRIYSSSTQKLKASNEINGSVSATIYNDSYGSTVYLKLKKSGTLYSMYASSDGENWGSEICSVTNGNIATDADNYKLMMGMFAQNGPDGTQSATAAFDFFHYKYIKNYLTIWKDHGIDPKDASYAYIMLPKATTQEVSSYAANPDITILENSEYAAAVKENTLDAVGVNFWKDGDKVVDIVRSDKKASVMTKVTDNQLDISVSDPTRLNTGDINIEIYKAALTTGYIIDPEITVLQYSPTVKLRVNVNGSAGKTFKAKLNLDTAVSTTAPAPTPIPTTTPYEYLVNDSFNGMAAGSAPAGWTCTTDGGTVTVEEVPDASNKSVKIYDNSTDSMTDASRTFTETSGVVTIECKVKPEQTNKILGAPYIYDSTGTIIGDVQFNSNGNIYAHNGATNISLQSYTANTWYSVKIILDTDTDKYDIYINDVLKGEQFSFRNTVTNISKAKFYTGTTGAFYFDDLRIYKAYSIVLNPNDDAYVRIGAYADTKYGTDESLAVNNKPADYTRQTFLKFDLSKIGANVINSTKLKLYAKSVAEEVYRTVNVNESGKLWDENDITWNTMPDAGSLITSFNVTNTAGMWYETNISDYVKNNIQQDKEVSLKLTVDPSVISYVTFSSKEDTGNWPQLGLTLPPPASFNPVEDAYVRGGSYSGTNYGSSDSLTVKQDINESFDRKVYMTFDFSSISSASIGGAKLKLYVNGLGSSNYKTIKVYAVPDETWSENTITWATAPNKGELITSFDACNTAGGWTEADLTDFVNANMTDKRISLLLINEGIPSSDSQITFCSGETANAKPTLEIQE